MCGGAQSFQSCPTPFNLMNCSPPSSSVQGDSPGKNTGAGCHALLQGIFPTPGLNPGLLHCRLLLTAESAGKPIHSSTLIQITDWINQYIEEKRQFSRARGNISGYSIPEKMEHPLKVGSPAAPQDSLSVSYTQQLPSKEYSMEMGVGINLSVEKTDKHHLNKWSKLTQQCWDTDSIIWCQRHFTSMASLPRTHIHSGIMRKCQIPS